MCPYNSACVGNNVTTNTANDYCRTGYEGPLCAVYSDGYYFESSNAESTCTECGQQTDFTKLIFVPIITVMIVIAFLVILFLGGSFAYRRALGENEVKKKGKKKGIIATLKADFGKLIFKLMKTQVKFKALLSFSQSRFFFVYIYNR